MKNILLTIFTFFLFSTILTAQITFQKTFGNAYLYTDYSVDLTSDGGYIITCYGASAGGISLIKVNASGDTLWTRNFTGLIHYAGWDVHQTTDGGYFLAGTASSLAGNTSACLIKTDSGGNILWAKTIGGPFNEYGNSAQQTNDGGYIICGQSLSYAAGPVDIYLVKTDGNGDTLWTKTFGGTAIDEGISVMQTNDGGYIITGTTDSFGAGSSDIYLIKTDGNGNMIWSKTFGGTGFDEASDVKQTNDGGYIIAGMTFSFGAGSYDMYLIRTDVNGDTLWTKTFGGGAYEAAYSVQQTSDGGFIIGGMAHSFGAGNEDVYLVKTNSTGDLLWSKVYGGVNDDDGFCFRQTVDSGFIICGFTYSFNNTGPPRIYLIKTDSNGSSGCNENNAATIVTIPVTQTSTPATIVSSGGNVGTISFAVSSGSDFATLCTSVGIEEPSRENNFSLFPNPASSQLNFSFPETGNYFLTIKNVLGETILVKSVSEKEFSVDVKDFPAGIYFVTVTDRKKNMVTRKFVKM